MCVSIYIYIHTYLYTHTISNISNELTPSQNKNTKFRAFHRKYFRTHKYFAIKCAAEKSLYYQKGNLFPKSGLF